MESFFSITFQEIVLVTVIVGIQLWVFFGTRSRLKLLKGIFPKKAGYRKITLRVAHEVLSKLEPTTIIEMVKQFLLTNPDKQGDILIYYYQRPLPVDQVDDLFKDTGNVPKELRIANFEEVRRYVSVDSAEVVPFVWLEQPSHNRVLEDILYSLNIYLLRNKGSVADFMLIKDIVDRNTDTVEQEVRTAMPVPLYLGLMGTMLGIVIGLFNMPNMGVELFTSSSSQASAAFAEGINILLGGVKIAMIASFSGLLLTTVNSGWFFRGALEQVEQRKNHFLTFTQMELLPVLSQNMTASIHDLRLNFQHFNEQFKENLALLGADSTNLLKTVETQKEVLLRLEQADFTQVVKSNVNTLAHIQESVEALGKSTDQLDRFQGYLQQVNEFVGQSAELNRRLLSVLDRTEAVGAITDQIHSNLQQNGQLQHFLSTHFSDLEHRGAVINRAVAQVDNSISESLGKLEDTARNRLQQFSIFLTEHQQEMERTLEGLEGTNQQVLSRITEKAEVFQERLSTTMAENVTVLNNLQAVGELNEQLREYIEAEKTTKSEIAAALTAFQAESKALREVLTQQVEGGKRPSRLRRVESWLTVIALVLASGIMVGGIGFVVYILLASS